MRLRAIWDSVKAQHGHDHLPDLDRANPAGAAEVNHLLAARLQRPGRCQPSADELATHTHSA